LLFMHQPYFNKTKCMHLPYIKLKLNLKITRLFSFSQINTYTLSNQEKLDDTTQTSHIFQVILGIHKKYMQKKRFVHQTKGKPQPNNKF
jgi:hypothetical protein